MARQGDDPVGEEGRAVRRVRCLRCNEVFPEEELGAHRRLHRAHAPYAPEAFLVPPDPVPD